AGVAVGGDEDVVVVGAHDPDIDIDINSWQAPGTGATPSGEQAVPVVMPDDKPEGIYVHERRLPYETFDADNHLYENQDALTKFLPAEYDGIIRYVDIDGRTKLAISDRISDYIPNPTFGRVAVPGGYGQDVTKGGDGVHRKAGDTAGVGETGKKPRVMPG